MASPAEQLRAAMLARLRAWEAFSAGVAGRIAEAQSAEFPCAWVGVTAADAGDFIDLLATVHVWDRAGEQAASGLLEEVRTALAEPPSVEELKVVSWQLDHSEVRADEEQAAHHGLVRFRARVRSG